MKLILRNFRLAFPDLFEAVQFQGKGPFNYGAQLLAPATGDGALARIEGDTMRPARAVIDETILQVATAKWGVKAKGYLAEIVPDKKACCWIDGNRREYDGYAGMWSLTAKRKLEKGAVLVIDADKGPLTARSGRPYPGCYVNATVEIYAQDSQDGKGIRCELLVVQFSKDGDSFAAGGRPSADDFDDISAGATADDLT